MERVLQSLGKWAGKWVETPTKRLQSHEGQHRLCIMPVKTSIVIPSMATQYLKYLVSSLRRQSVKPWEVILVVKADERGLLEVERGCVSGVIEQRRGYVTTALNIGERNLRV